MRILLWFVLGAVGFSGVGRAGAQDSLSFTNPITLQASPDGAASYSRWRLSGYAGYNQLIQRGYLDENLYLTHGFHSSVAVDFFPGRQVGIGVLVGYQNLAVSDQYRQDPSIPRFPAPLLFPLTSLHTFMLTAGPAFSFPMGRRLSLDIALRGGLFYNDAPVLGAYYLTSTQDDLESGTLLTSIIPSNQRINGGANAFFGLTYQLGQRVNLGVSANGSYSSFRYAQLGSSSFFSQKRVDLQMVGVQVAVTYALSSAGRRSKKVTVVPPSPVCYPPLLDPAQPNQFDARTTERPVFKWKSTAPVYTEGEQYTFRLYTLPGSKLLYERTLREPQLTWPAQLLIPDSSSLYFYSVHTSRIDDFDQSCRSEPVIGSIGFFKRQPVVQSRVAPITAAPVNLYTLELYELIPVAPGPAPATARRTQLPARRSVGGRPTTAPRKTAPDTLSTLVKTQPRNIFNGPVPQVDFTWPTGLPLPVRTTVYQCIIRQMTSHAIVKNHYLLIGTDGTQKRISEAEKNRHFLNNRVLTDQTGQDPSPPVYKEGWN